MGEVRFAPGEVVFREGEPSRTVLFVREGEVEVAKAAGTGEVVLGTVGPGEFAGEMGVIEGRPRSATVRARGEVLGEMVERRAFLERVSRDPRLAFGVLLRLSERLHAADERLAEAVARRADETHATVTADAVPAVAGDRVVLFAAEALAGRIPAEGIAIDRLPFEVGRRPAADQPGGAPVQLELEDAAPYRLSRRHFAIVARAEGLAVRDDYSTLGHGGERRGGGGAVPALRGAAATGREPGGGRRGGQPARVPARRRLGARPRPRRRTRMPRSKPFILTGTAELNAMIERVAPAILALLADGVPRTKPAIVEALAGRHEHQDVVHALVRLAVTGQVEETGGKYALAPGPVPDMH